MNNLTPLDLVGFKQAETQSLNSQCTIKRLTQTYDELGDAVKSYSGSLVISCGANFQLEGKADFRFSYDVILTPGDLVYIGDSIYEIQSVIEKSHSVKANGVIYVS